MTAVISVPVQCTQSPTASLGWVCMALIRAPATQALATFDTQHSTGLPHTPFGFALLGHGCTPTSPIQAHTGKLQKQLSKHITHYFLLREKRQELWTFLES